MRTHLQGSLDRARQEKKRQEILAELALPEFPEAVRYLWNAYWKLRRRKATDAYGNTLPIDWFDLDAFNRLSGLRLLPWEIDIIDTLDTIYLSERARARES